MRTNKITVKPQNRYEVVKNLNQSAERNAMSLFGEQLETLNWIEDFERDFPENDRVKKKT